ncbi:MAG TPA: hypothetical protein VFA35_05725, partial [Burkholderiaceae bacterium]|nr:hypothetical protein [Burkholderiaceae bacterium]
MIAKLDPTNPKPAGVSGGLTSVNVATRTFVLEKRALDNTSICSFTVAAASNTVFQIDGTVYAGFGGLATLANQSLGAAHVFVQGTYGTGAHTINALAVESGSGVPGNGQSWVVGHVVGRDHTAGQDATLSVLGHSFDVGSGTRLYNTLHTVQVALGTTKVLRFGAGNSLTTDALQVGQRVAVFGTLTGTNLDARGIGTTPDVARILFTSVFGIATGAPVGNTLTIDVARFDLRDISNFNFSVGGITESDPHTYTVDVTGLSTTGITTNSRVRCIGWANPVGVAGDSDFQSISLVDRGVDGKAMLCFWSPANAQALPSVSSTAIGLDVSAAAVKVVSDGFTTTGINTSPAPSLEPFTSIGFYLIVQNSGIELHLQFAPFTTSLSNRLLAGAAVRRVSALGRYDAPSQTFAALVSTVVLQ